MSAESDAAHQAARFGLLQVRRKYTRLYNKLISADVNPAFLSPNMNYPFYRSCTVAHLVSWKGGSLSFDSKSKLMCVYTVPWLLARLLVVLLAPLAEQ